MEEGSSVSAVVAQVSLRTVWRERERDRERRGGVRERGSLKCDSQSQGEGYTAKIFFSTAARRNCSGLQQNS